MHKYPTRLWDVSVSDFFRGGTQSSQVTAPTRGKALAKAWACDAFEGTTFKRFLQHARCRQAELPAWWCQPIALDSGRGPEQVFYLGLCGSRVRICRANGAESMAHPTDIHPEYMRPAAYRSSPPPLEETQQLLRHAASFLSNQQTRLGHNAERDELLQRLRQLGG